MDNSVTTVAEPGEIDQLDYEAAIAELDRVLAELEDGMVPLETAMGLYERGVALVRRCSGLLDGAERRVTQLSTGPSGEPSEGTMLLVEEEMELGGDQS